MGHWMVCPCLETGIGSSNIDLSRRRPRLFAWGIWADRFAMDSPWLAGRMCEAIQSGETVEARTSGVEKGEETAGFPSSRILRC